jgi:hypothetical protein
MPAFTNFIQIILRSLIINDNLYLSPSSGMSDGIQSMLGEASPARGIVAGGTVRWGGSSYHARGVVTDAKNWNGNHEIYETHEKPTLYYLSRVHPTGDGSFSVTP